MGNSALFKLLQTVPNSPIRVDFGGVLRDYGVNLGGFQGYVGVMEGLFGGDLGGIRESFWCLCGGCLEGIGGDLGCKSGFRD